MYVIPTITPICNLKKSCETLREIYKYKKNNWAIGQLYPNGGPDSFTYFFSIRGIPIANYLRGNISIGNPTAYDVNIAALRSYINWVIQTETTLVYQEIERILFYKANNFAIGEQFPDGGPDEFVVFFAQRKLPIKPYLRGTVNIGYPTAYDENIAILTAYLKKLQSYSNCSDCNCY